MSWPVGCVSILIARRSNTMSRYEPAPEVLKEALIETYRSQISLVLEGMRYLTIVSGGALIALTAQLGSWSRDCAKAPDFALAARSLFFSLLFSLVAYFFAYLSQVNFLKLCNEKLEHQHADIRIYKVGHIGMFVVAAVAIIICMMKLYSGVSYAVGAVAHFTCTPLTP